MALYTEREPAVFRIIVAFFSSLEKLGNAFSSKIIDPESIIKKSN